MSTIYFPVVAKYFDLLLLGYYIVVKCNIILKVFDKFFWNNKSQIKIFKLLKDGFLQKWFRTVLIFIT